jgi:hypothetical protein
MRPESHGVTREPGIPRVSHRYPTGTDEHETRVPSPVPGDPGRKPRMGSGDGSEVSTRRSLVLAIRVSEANEPGSSGNWQLARSRTFGGCHSIHLSHGRDALILLGLAVDG